MRYEILGPVRVANGDHFSSISARKVELLLIVLLSRANNVVTMDQLISEIWAGKIPRRAVAAVHVYMSQLRKFLDRLGRPQHIVTRSQGYQMLLEPDEIDTGSFLHGVGTGRAHTRNQQYEAASSTFEKALSIWRGPIVWDTDSGLIVKSYATYLTEARLECIEMLIDAQLKLGYHRQLVGQLYTLTAEYPLREVFYQQLMLALYRCSRQADALSVYQSAQRILGDELGVDPCRSLQRIHRSILMADDRLLLLAQSNELF
jgi:SARP family transcriptional regulator, regulator of embCAB operon